MPRLTAGGFGARAARENGDSQECARELDAGPGCYRTTNATGAWSDHRSLLHVQGCRLQSVSVVAVKGGKVPIDAGNLVTSREHDKGFEESDDIAALENTQALNQVKIQAMVEDIDRIFFADSHGIFVVFEDEWAEIVTRLYAAGKVEAVVCNDTTGLVGAKDSAGFLVRCGSSLVLWRVAGIWMEELAQRTQVGHQCAVIELHQDRLMRQHTPDADRVARVPVTPIAQDTRAHLVDLRIGNKPEMFAGESHDWKGRQKVAGFSNDEEKTVGLYGKELNVLEIKSEELGVKYIEGEIFKWYVVWDERLITGQNPMSSVTCLRERRLQDESSEILFNVTFAYTTSADTFSNELTEAATDVESHFESSISETFNFTVEVAVTVTADDDNDDITVLPAVEEHVYIICRLGVGRRLGSSVTCPRGAGRRLRRRITCRCGAEWRMSTRVTCPSTKSCTAGTDSRVHALWGPRCLWQAMRLVGGNAEDRAEDLRADADGGPSCGWGPTGASAAEVDPLQAQAIVEESVDGVMGAVSAGCYDEEWFHEADFSVPLGQACKGTFFCGGMLFRRTLAPTMKRYVDEALIRFREEERFSKCMSEVLGAAGLSDETYKKKANNHTATAFEEAYTNSSDGTMVAANPEVAMLQEFIKGWMTEFVTRSWDVLEN